MSIDRCSSVSEAGRYAVILLFLFADLACTEQREDVNKLVGISIEQDTQRQWRLPNRLREISGLALTPDGRLLAVHDEKAIVYEMDYESGRLIKQFALGKPVVRGDFEGIAHADGHLFLITSKGLLYKALEGSDGEQVGYEKFDTGLGQKCEFEGLAQDLERQRLLLMCKVMADDDMPLTVFVWRLSDNRIDRDANIELPVSDVVERLQTDGLHPSGIAIHPVTGSILIVAARQRALVELDREGNFVEATGMRLAKRHRQPEGIAISRSGRLFIADEGGRSRARLTVYESIGSSLKNET